MLKTYDTMGRFLQWVAYWCELQANSLVVGEDDPAHYHELKNTHDKYHAAGEDLINFSKESK